MTWEPLEQEIPGTALVKDGDDTPHRRHRCIATAENLETGELRVEFQDPKAAIYRTNAGPFPMSAVIEATEFTPDEEAEDPGGSAMVNEGGA